MGLTGQQTSVSLFLTRRRISFTILLSDGDLVLFPRCQQTGGQIPQSACSNPAAVSAGNIIEVLWCWYLSSEERKDFPAS